MSTSAPANALANPMSGCRRLRISFDPEPLATEFDPGLWPAKEITLAAGRQRCFVIGSAGDHSPCPSPQLEQLPHMRALLAEALPGRALRAHYSILGAGARVTLHTDGVRKGDFYQRTVRVHLPLTSNEGSAICARERFYRMRPGELWTLETFAPHAAINLGTDRRVHLIADLEPDERLDALMQDALPDEAFEDPELLQRVKRKQSWREKLAARVYTAIRQA